QGAPTPHLHVAHRLRESHRKYDSQQEVDHNLPMLTSITATTMTAIARRVGRRISSPAMAQPRKTATTGWAWAKVEARAGWTRDGAASGAACAGVSRFNGEGRASPRIDELPLRHDDRRERAAVGA